MPGSSSSAGKPSTPPRPKLRVVVLDPAHGGTDLGARGPGGAVEKEMVLLMAKAARAELERAGLRVVLTRDADQDPSFDDRAAIANAQRDAVFLSFHVSSTGTSGTARVYSYQFSVSATPAAGGTPSGAPAGLREWDEAQKPFVNSSRRLANLLQVELAQKFPGSPEISSAAAVRGLRSVAAPAVAVEISSMAVPNPESLGAMALPLATAVARAVIAFKSLYEAGAQ